MSLTDAQQLTIAFLIVTLAGFALGVLFHCAYLELSAKNAGPVRVQLTLLARICLLVSGPFTRMQERRDNKRELNEWYLVGTILGYTTIYEHTPADGKKVPTHQFDLYQNKLGNRYVDVTRFGTVVKYHPRLEAATSQWMSGIREVTTYVDQDGKREVGLTPVLKPEERSKKSSL